MSIDTYEGLATQRSTGNTKTNFPSYQLQNRPVRISPSETLVEVDENFSSSQNVVRNRSFNHQKPGSGIINKKGKLRTKFYQLECFRYVESEKQGICGCGLPREHSQHLNISTDPEWSGKCTRRVPTTAFGEIEFTEDVQNSNKRKPYVRVSHKTDAQKIYKLMIKEWKLKRPNLVISVTGGAKSFSIKPKLKEAFTKGLIKVAVSTNAWIITGGTNAGVMKHVGEAVSKRGHVGNSEEKINVLGISPWGVLQNSNMLISKDGSPCRPAEYSYDTTDPTKTGLDFNHTHFILVDNGTTGKYGTEIKLRSQIEETIAKAQTSSMSTSGAIGIPVVILCLEGGPNTIKTMAEAIKRNTPAVVIDGTGRAADVVSFAYNHMKTDENEVSKIDPMFVDEVKTRIIDDLKVPTKAMESVYANVQQLLKDLTMVTVFRLDDASGQSDMDLAILKALLKANKGNTNIKVRGMIDTIKKGTTSRGDKPTDVVYFACKHQKITEDGKIHIAPQYVAEVRKKVMSVFGKFGNEVYERILQLLQEKNKVDAFCLFDKKKQTEHEIEILNYLLQDIVGMEVKKTTFQTQLKLALAWSRIDVAKSEIFTESLKRDNYKIEWLYESMFVALSNDKPDFVELFLNEGLNLKHFLTLKRLEKLYNEIPDSSAFYGFTSQIFESKTLDMSHIADIMQELMGDRYRSRYRDEPYTTQRKVSSGSAGSINKLSPDSVDEGEEKSEMYLPEPNLDLFTWAILCNRRPLAFLIWKNSKNSIASAIMATKLLKSLAEKISDNKELADQVDELQGHANFYEVNAVGVLDECRRAKDDLAQTLVVRELENIGGLTCLDIAVSANDREFIAHPTCQTLLSRLWMGALYLNTSFWRVLPCIFFPFLIPILILFREDAESYVQEEDCVDQIEVNENAYHEEYDEMSASLQGSRESLSFMKAGKTSNMLSVSGTQNNNTENLEHHDSHSIIDHFDDENNESVEAAMRGTHETSFIHRMLDFYDAPFVKFVTNVISYSIFLLLYSFIIVTRFEMKIDPFEYLLHGWVATLIFEEIRQFLTQEPDTFIKKLEFYFSDPWNIADTFSLFSFVVAAILRFYAYISNNENFLIAARIIFATDVTIFFIRLVQIFLVNRHLGPKIVMIRRMLVDLGYFVVLLFVMIIAYGVAQQAVLYPNTRNLWEAIKGVLDRPYWQMYGELFYEDIFEDKLNQTTGIPLCKQPGAEDPCPDEIGRSVLPFYMAFYMLLTNILLLNLLIAIFNCTFEKVQEESDKVWKFGRYDLISEYHNRPALCPPLIIISHIFIFLYWLISLWCCKQKSKKGSSLKMSMEPEENETLDLWEYGIMEMYCIKTNKIEAESQDERVKSILNKVNNLTEDFKDFNSGDIIAPSTPCVNVAGGQRKSVSTNQLNIEARLTKMETNIEYILDILLHQKQKREDLKSSREKSIEATGENNKNLIITLHTKARVPIYPSTTVKRFKVPDAKVLWDVPFPEYAPVKYTAPFVLSGPYWADDDIMEMAERPLLAYNQFDHCCQVNRESHTGHYEVFDALPRNPFGRTGIIGRGSLGRFGPNHAADPIVTRWKRSSSGIETDKGKKILEFIAIMRKDNCQWAIPGGMVEPGQNVSETLRKEFTEEALAKLDMDEEKRGRITKRVKELFKDGKEVYKGYVDDPRNTDNAWMETVACNFHDDTGEIFGEFKLQAGDDAQAVRWQRVSGNIPLFASHVGILKQVAKMHDAAFY